MNNKSLPGLLLIALQKIRICRSASIAASRFVSSGLYVGKTVWVVGMYKHNSGLTETIVTKVGKKYFELERVYNAKFFIDTLLHDGKGYSSSYRVYLSKQEYLDEIEASQLSENIKKRLSQHGRITLSLDKLRAIWELIRP